jgi:hypothetical protein
MTKPRETGVIYSGPMMQAHMAGLKTQTRRLRGLDRVNAEPDRWRFLRMIHNRNNAGHSYAEFLHISTSLPNRIKSHFGGPGDVIWSRETFCLETNFHTGEPDDPPFSDGRPVKWSATESGWQYWEQPHYRATDPTPELSYDDDEDGSEPKVRWKPSIFQPRWVSRFVQPLLSIRVERLQDISEADARAEGIRHFDSDKPGQMGWYGVERDAGRYSTATDVYESLWGEINGPGSWERNPWVWRIEYENPFGKAARDE